MDILKSLKSRLYTAFQYIDRYGHLLPEAIESIFTFRVDIISLTGQIRGQDENVTLLYVGRKWNLAYLKKLFFVDPDIVESRRANLLTFLHKMKSSETNADVIFLDIGWPYHGVINHRGEYLEIPDWLNMVVPIGDDWDTIKKRFRRTTRNNELRLIRRNNYRCDPTNDLDFIRKFYDDYYVPFATYRHGDAVGLSSRSEVEKRAEQGTILRVIGDIGPVAAGVVFTKDGVLYCYWTGMPTAYIENPPEAAIAALNYFGLRYAFDNSLEEVDLMGTRSFPDDGVFQSKRKWGAVVKDHNSPSSILFKPANNNQKAAIFSEQFPLVIRRNGALELMICVTEKESSDLDNDRLMSKYYCEGIDQVTIVHLSDKKNGVTVNPSTKHLNVKVVSCDLQNFSSAYTRNFRMNTDKN